MKRKLALRREVLAELPEVDLRAVAGGRVTELCISAYTYVSCNPFDCLLSDRKTICLES